MARPTSAAALGLSRARKENPATTNPHEVLDRELVRVAEENTWRAGTGVYVKCDANGYCVLVRRPGSPDQQKGPRLDNPAKAAKKALSLVAYGKVDPSAPKAPDRIGKRRANPIGDEELTARMEEREREWDEEGEDLHQKKAEEKLTAAFGTSSGPNADWLEKAWYVAGATIFDDTGKGLYVVSQGSSGINTEYCILERDQDEDLSGSAEQFEELFCGDTRSIDKVILQAQVFKALRYPGKKAR